MVNGEWETLRIWREKMVWAVCKGKEREPYKEYKT
jgi:hypothetical protein